MRRQRRFTPRIDRSRGEPFHRPEHLRRLRVRLRYGLPITNPLDHEVRERYPDVHAVASEIVQSLGPMGEGVVPPEEVGFLTMYLAGSLERHRLRQKVRVTVVCPAGSRRKSW